MKFSLVHGETVSPQILRFLLFFQTKGLNNAAKSLFPVSDSG
jgi:hypothetical protein